MRELRNVIERAAILAGDVVQVADLPEDPHASPFDEEGEEDSEAPETGDRVTPVQAAAPVRDGGEEKKAAEDARPRWLPLRVFRERVERWYIVKVLASLGWNVKRSAVVLEVERTTLTKKIRGYGIKRGETPGSAEEKTRDSAPPRGYSLLAGGPGGDVSGHRKAVPTLYPGRIPSRRM